MSAARRLGGVANLANSPIAQVVGVLVALASISAWSGIVVSGIRHGNFLFLHGATSPFGDLYEHFEDGSVLLRGGDLYALRPFLNNSNPPVVTLLYLPLRALGRGAGIEAMTALSLASVAAVGAVCIHRLRGWRPAWAFAAAGIVVVPAALVVSEPLRAMLKAGQIRGVLLALVVVDLLAVRPARRGYLTGIAGAVALTPLAFVVLIGITAGTRAVLRCAGAFACLSLLGLAAGWHASIRYWFVLVPTGAQAQRVLLPYPAGTDPYASRGQASLRALLARPPFAWIPARWAVWAVLAVLIAVLTWWVVRRLLNLGLEITAVGLFAVAVLVVEPATWNHYWVWGILGYFAAFEAWSKSRTLALAALIVPVACLPVTAHVMGAASVTAHWPGAASRIYCVAGIAWICVAAAVLGTRRDSIETGAPSSGDATFAQA